MGMGVHDVIVDVTRVEQKTYETRDTLQWWDKSSRQPCECANADRVYRREGKRKTIHTPVGVQSTLSL